MAEYIDREAAIAWFMPYVHIGGYISADDMVEDIRNLPAADVAPVVRGRWVHTTIEDEEWGGTYHKWSCSICDYSTGSNQSGSNFCPNCGARMEG